MRSWKTTVGGACSSLGTFLIGAGVIPSLTSLSAAEQLKWLVITGFVLQGLGNFFANLFAADEQVVKRAVKKAIEDTDFTKKP